MSLDVKITLVVPILNEAISLPELLGGIKTQTLHPNEIIFCDAGSTDGSQDLIKDWWEVNGWNNASLKVLSLHGAMPGAGRNAGVRAASNDWIAFLDGGIIPANDWLKNLYSFSQKRSSEAIFGVCYFAGSTTFAKAVCALSYGQGSLHPVIPASLFSKTVFMKVGFFPENLRAGEDILWLNSFFEQYTTRDVCDEAHVSYVHFPDSLIKAIRKWKVYEFYCVQAGIRKRQQYLYLFSPLIFMFVFLHNPMYAFGVGTLYFGVRGFIEPIRRSSARPWWGDSPKAILIAPCLALLLDISKWSGIVQGLSFKICREIRGLK